MNESYDIDFVDVETEIMNHTGIEKFQFSKEFFELKYFI